LVNELNGEGSPSILRHSRSTRLLHLVRENHTAYNEDPFNVKGSKEMPKTPKQTEAAIVITEDPIPETSTASVVQKIATIAAAGFAIVAAGTAIVRKVKATSIEAEVAVAKEEPPAAEVA
jgi:hypothetical protein